MFSRKSPTVRESVLRRELFGGSDQFLDVGEAILIFVVFALGEGNGDNRFDLSTRRITSSGGWSINLVSSSIIWANSPIALAALPFRVEILSTWDAASSRLRSALVRVLTQMFQRHLADAAGRFIDDAQKRQFVARIDQEPQIGHHVAIFLAIEERQALHDLKRHAILDERRFQAPRQAH